MPEMPNLREKMPKSVLIASLRVCVAGGYGYGYGM